MLRVITSLPTIERLRADVKMTAGEPSIVTTGVIIIKPL